MADVTPVLTAYLARNRGPVLGNPDARQPPDYGVSASLEGSAVELTLTFRAGSAYCCCQRGCHLDLAEGTRWGRLRRGLSKRGLGAPPRLELRLAVVIEAGALFFDLSRPDPAHHGWYAFAAAESRRYEVVANEADGPGG